MKDTQRATYILAGAALDTGNLGVSALGLSVLHSLARIQPESRVVLLDNGRGSREFANTSGLPDSFGVELRGARLTRRVYQQESYSRILAAIRFGFPPSQLASVLKHSAAVLDISGGDSFTDLYGDFRYRQVAYPKKIAFAAGKPLILLPQTYGPFDKPGVRASARSILQRTRIAWARDPISYDYMKELLGTDYDPERHKSGVDVAFALPVREPVEGLSEDIREMLRSKTVENRPIGVNVSGLIYNSPDVARRRFKMRLDYKELVERLLVGLIDSSDVPILLIPHVLVPSGSPESDMDACIATRDALPDSLKSRVICISPVFDAIEMKWIISRCQWFCGTRMHSTIAALSSEVPCAAVAYSMKTQGVFDICGVGDAVVDPRTTGLEESVERLLLQYRERTQTRMRLAGVVGDVRNRAADQIAEIVQTVRSVAFVQTQVAGSHT